jgi:DNA-binding LytR/AlgR family response regulator
MTTPSALIAEDEPLLAAQLQAELGRAWPQLQVLDVVGDGLRAVTQALALQPDVLFFDVRMPGQSGLQAAADLADQWPNNGKPFPLLVFVTAYDQYAVQAFETQAVDYLLKPVQPERLQKTVRKLAISLANTSSNAIDIESPSRLDASLEATLGQLRQLLDAGVAQAPCSQPRLQVIQASVGASLHWVQVSEVAFFEAADKYLRVVTAEREHLIRTPLKDLLPQLDPAQFWQIHRGTVVNTRFIQSATRDDSGRFTLTLRGLTERLVVSRLYAHLFKAM